MGKGRFLDSDGNTVMTAADLNGLIKGGTPVEKKFFLQNTSNSTSGILTMVINQMNNDNGSASLLKDVVAWQLCQTTLSCPYALAAALSGGGSLSQDITYYYKVTAANPSGETAGSLEVSKLTDASNKTIALAWDSITGATGYHIYRSPSRTYSSRLATVYTNSFLDDGSRTALSGLSLPSENTTFGSSPNYGSAPLTGWAPAPSGVPATSLSIGTLKSGQQKAVWLRTAVPSAQAVETGAAMQITITEG